MKYIKICLNCKDKVEEHYKLTAQDIEINAKCELCSKKRKCIQYKVDRKV